MGVVSSFRFRVSDCEYLGEERLVMSHSYKDLIVWQKARMLAGEIYRTSELFPKNEVYGLTSQMRRAAISVASNIAEGQGRVSRVSWPLTRFAA